MIDLKKANKLSESISNLSYFIEIVDPEKNVIRGSGQRDIGMSLKRNTKTSFSILGERWIGFSTIKKEIEIPNELVEKIQEMAIKMKEDCEKELQRTLVEVCDSFSSH